MPQPNATMNDLDRVSARYFDARRELLEAMIAAHLGGGSANQIARRVSSVPGLNRNRVLTILAAARRAHTAETIIAESTDYQDLRVELDEIDFDLAWISSMSEAPLGDDRAHRPWTALTRHGLTIASHRNKAVPVDDPQAALASLARRSPAVYLVNLPTRP